LKKSYEIWIESLPDVKPYYAVKCNPDLRILDVLGKLGVAFDCASPFEIESVLALGNTSQTIIYANPCKKETDIKFAVENNIHLSTFDTLCELEKISKIDKNAELILRIYASDSQAKCILSDKYGAIEAEWEGLLSRAHELNVKIIGISFHIGSGASNPKAFQKAITQARRLYNVATKKYNFPIKILDLGGGFTQENIHKMSPVINEALKLDFGDIIATVSDFKIIGEPGRYFAENVATLFTKIIGIRERTDSIDYWITDSLYGSFNCLIYDHANLMPSIVINKNEEKISTTIYGPTCDGYDIILSNKQLPRMKYGDWLVWPNMGAYTIAAACDFNGLSLTKPRKLYI
jgi:ornithine decarboxylase